MPLYFISTVITLMSIAIPYHLFLSPQVAFEAGLIDTEPPLCRRETPFETHSRYQINNNDAGKSARFSRRNGSICSRPLFDRTERHTSYDYVLRRSQKLINEIVKQAAQKTAYLSDPKNVIWMVRTRDSIPPELQSVLKATALESLVSTVGIHHVSRRKEPFADESPTTQAILTLGLRPVIDEDLLFEADIYIKDRQKTTTWNIQ
jgi:hypothetical protein